MKFVYSLLLSLCISVQAYAVNDIKAVAELFQRAQAYGQPVAFSTSKYHNVPGAVYYQQDMRTYLGTLLSSTISGDKVSFRIEQYTDPGFYPPKKSFSLKVPQDLVAPRKTGSMYFWGSVLRLNKIKELDSSNWFSDRPTYENLKPYEGYYARSSVGDNTYIGIINRVEPTYCKLVSTAYGYKYGSSQGSVCYSGKRSGTKVLVEVFEIVESVD